MKYKAKLVAKGYRQVQGFDFQEKSVTVRVILTLAISRKWHITQLDMNNAFLNGLLEEEVYMQQPRGFREKDQESSRTTSCKNLLNLWGRY